MALKIELKPERADHARRLRGDQYDQRTRLMIEGTIPILREKDIMSLGRADTPAKLLYLAVQFIYIAKQPQENYALYFRLAEEFPRPPEQSHISIASIIRS